MMFKTHLAFSLLISLIAFKIFAVQNPVLFTLSVLLGTVFLDIDTTKSKIGKKFKPLSFVLNLLFGHRGFIHTIYLPVAALLFSLVISRGLIGYGFLLGYFSHLFLDSLSLAGISPFTPLSKFRVSGFIKTNSFSEYILFFVIVWLTIYFII